MRVLETERLLLRPVRPEDAEAIYEYSRVPDVGVNAGWKPHESISETEEIMKAVFLDQEAVWAVTRKDDGVLIGTAGLIGDPKREYGRARMLGYAIGRPYWGRGCMTEAVRAVINCGFTELDLDLISAYCYPENQRSKRVLTKCGFEYEGLLRMAEERFDGHLMDNECYALLRSKVCSSESGI